jgi:hypothetical protein
MAISFKIPKVLKIFKYISFKIFIASFLIGLLFLYLMGPQNKKVYVYPSPQTVDRAIFQDKAGQCFLYKEENVDCPTNKKEISVIPVQ